MGSLFTFVNLWMLGLIPLGIAALLYAYRRGGRGDQIPASSLFILQIIQRESAASRKIRPPLRILLDFLTLILILCAAAGLLMQTSGERTLLVIDNSFSMSAGINRTSFERAIELARKKLDSLSFFGQAAIMTVCPAPQLRTNGFKPLGEVRTNLDALNPQFCSDNLEEVIGTELSRMGASHAVIFTDRSAPFVSVRPGNDQELGIEVVKISPLDEASYNLSLQDLVLHQSKVGVQVKRYQALNSTQVPASVTASLLQGDPEGNGWREVFRKNVTLENGAGAIELDLPESGQIFSLTIEPPQGELPDALREDNTLYFVRGASGNRIGVISPLSPDQLGLNKVAGFEFEQIEEDELQRGAFHGTAVVFHRSWPAIRPAQNSLVVFPLDESGSFETEILKGVKKVTRWDASHPLTSYLNLPLLEVQNPRVIKPSSWLRSVIATERGALVAAGENNQFRQAYIGFEIFPYQGKKSPLISILTLNALRWLTASSGRSGFRLVGESLSVREGQQPPTYLYRSDSKMAENPAPVGGPDQPWIFDSPGIVSAAAQNSMRDFIAINYISREEADLFQRPDITIPAIPRQVQVNEHSGRSLDWHLIVAAILLLLLIWLLDLRIGRAVTPRIQ